MEFKYLFFIALVVLFLDFIYLTLFQNYFKKVFKQIQKTPLVINYKGVILSYLFIILSIYYFFVNQKLSLFSMFLLGLFIYGIYEFTNYATLKKWPIQMVFFDTLWGGILYFATAFIIQYIQTR
jgi:uncharacterized membrane protein